VGTVDQDYKGIFGVDLINCGTEPYEVKRGDRIAQMIFRTDIDFQIPELTDEKERGDGGFGSTGK
jgi:dUTP pyrophosphatase